MKRLLLTTAMLIALPAMAGAQTATGTGTANSSSTSGAIAVGGGGGTAQAGGGNAKIIFNNPGSTTSNNTSRIRQSGSLKTTPNAIAPGLGSAGIETCYGPGVSGGVSVTGFGASFGAGQFDTDCNARLYSRTLFAMGYKQQAINLLVNESGMVQRAFGLGQQARPVYGAAPRVMSSGYVNNGGYVDNGGCKKWAGGNVGGQCLYY